MDESGPTEVLGHAPIFRNRVPATWLHLPRSAVPVCVDDVWKLKKLLDLPEQNLLCYGT